jgi:16S rRNA (guanine966-N2)-methyltransferase
MRIIRGESKRRLHLPGHFDGRPTTDVAKEALFNILENNYNFDNIKVLDLFSGTGSISYEFASRGCEDITLVEMNRQNFDFIQKSIRDFSFSQISAINGDAFRFLEKEKIQYDVIFADPPYNLENIEKIPQIIFERSLLTKEGWLILEHSAQQNFSSNPYFERERHYGKVHFTFFSIPLSNNGANGAES